MITVNKDFNDIPQILLKDKKNAFSDKSVLNKLKEIYRNKCAFCEQKSETLYIDHYRPKAKVKEDATHSGYYWLENEWSNLLPVCAECNTIKGANFPINGKQVKEKPLNKENNRADSELLLSEQPVIIHPEVDTPENHFYYDKSGIAYGNTGRGQKNINILNLNRQFLIQKRKSVIDTVNECINKVEINNLPEEKIVELILEVFVNLDKISEDENEEFTLLRRQIINHFPDFYFDSTDDKKNKLLIKIYKKYLLIKHDIKNIQSNKKLPLALHGFRIRNFQGIKDLQIHNIPLESNFIFLTGENASGKTSVLRALLIGFVGDKELKQNEISEDSRVELMYKNDKELIISEFRGNYHILEKNIAAYGTIRILLSKDEKQLPITNSLFEKGTDLLNIENKLIELDGGTANLENLKNSIISILKNLVPNLHDIKVEPTDTGKKIVYYENSFEDTKENMVHNFKKVSFYQLAAGMRSIIGMIGDMLLRFWENQPNLKDFKDLSGIVLIDEIENHLHPNWQKQFMLSLKKSFNKVQFVIATHSPITLLGAPEGSVILNMQRTEDDQVTMIRLDDQIDFNKLLPNSLLTSDIFKMENITNEDAKLEDIETIDDFKQIEIQKRLREKFNLLKQTDTDFFNDLIKPKNE